MITVSNAVKDVFKKEYSIVVSTGGTIEYNLNNMVDKITAKSSGTDHALSNAFKNLFPIDSIYSSYMPLRPGIKYYIYTICVISQAPLQDTGMILLLTITIIPSYMEE